MSVRERIAQNIFDTLEANSMVRQDAVCIRKLSRDPIIFEELSREAFPALFMESANESREDISMGGPDVTRNGSIEYILDVYVHGANRDKQLNEVMDLVETALDADRKRGGHADDTQLREIETITVGEGSPYYGMRMIFEVLYCYKTGVA